MSFLKVEDRIFKDNRLTSDDKLAYALLERRMNLSKQHIEFFDRAINQYYVHYSQTELANELGCSVRKIQSVLGRLDQFGYITRKKRFNATDKIYLTFLSANSAYKDKQDLPTKKKNIAKDTVVSTNNTINTARNDALTGWRLATHNKMGLADDVISAIEQLADRDVTKCRSLVKLLNNAKKHVLSHFGLHPNQLRYEVNESLDQPLTQQLLQLNDYATSLSAEARSKYYMRSFINFFKQAAGLDHRNWLPDEPKRAAEKPKLDPDIPIPTFKIN